MGNDLLQRIIEGILMAAAKPLTVEELRALFDEGERPQPDDVRTALTEIAAQCAGRGFELREVASGFRFQVIQEVAPWVARLWEEKPQKYSRALLETLALIAYRQPITRGDIEDIRGVAVATNIIKTLLERDWVRVVGHKDVPGRPAMYATTRRFLDYFNLKNLEDLPPLADLRDLDALSAQLSIEGADTLLPEQQSEHAEQTASDESEAAMDESETLEADAIDKGLVLGGEESSVANDAVQSSAVDDDVQDTELSAAPPLGSVS
jgi:segregation and condensation protein B